MSETQYTEEQIKELQLCAADPVYFIKNYYHIRHHYDPMFLFKMYPFQERLIHRYNTYDRNVSLGARQTGSTTCLEAYALWNALFKSDCPILVASFKLANARAMIENIRYALDRMPKWLLPKIVTNNKSEVAFENGSYIYAVVATGDTLRGRTLDLVIWDGPMYGRPVHAFEFWDVLKGHMSFGKGKVIIANSGTKKLKAGEENLFVNMWQDALRNSNGFVTTQIMWDEPPGRGELFEEAVKSYISESDWRREYLCEFVVEE